MKLWFPFNPKSDTRLKAWYQGWTFGWLIDDGWSWHLKSSLAVRAVPVPRKKSLAIAAGVISQLMSTKFLFHRVYTPSIPVVPVKSPFPLDYIHFFSEISHFPRLDPTSYQPISPSSTQPVAWPYDDRCPWGSPGPRQIYCSYYPMPYISLHHMHIFIYTYIHVICESYCILYLLYRNHALCKTPGWWVTYRNDSMGSAAGEQPLEVGSRQGQNGNICHDIMIHIAAWSSPPKSTTSLAKKVVDHFPHDI